ncbi:MAG: helix-turn-helix domain-containing protein [Candidatus Acidiferrales bacterium]
MEKTPFGEQLRREREMRGVTLDEISAATRISVRFLEALESAQWKQLPGGVFNRGFIRSVARYLGLDEESLIAEYVSETTNRSEPPSAASQQPLPGRAAKIAIVVTIFIGVVALGWAGYKWIARRKAHLVPPASASALPRTAPAFRSSASRPAARPSAPAKTSSLSSGAGAASPAASDEAALELKVEAGNSCEVSVSADGAALFSGSMQPGDQKVFRAKKSVEIYASDSSAVLLELNGQLMPPVGPAGQPGKLTLTRDNLKKP